MVVGFWGKAETSENLAERKAKLIGIKSEVASSCHRNYRWHYWEKTIGKPSLFHGRYGKSHCPAETTWIEVLYPPMTVWGEFFSQQSIVDFLSPKCVVPCFLYYYYLVKIVKQATYFQLILLKIYKNWNPFVWYLLFILKKNLILTNIIPPKTMLCFWRTHLNKSTDFGPLSLLVNPVLSRGWKASMFLWFWTRYLWLSAIFLIIL